MKYMKLFAVMLVAALMVVAGCEKKAGTGDGAPADVDGEPATTGQMKDAEGAPDPDAPKDADVDTGNEPPSDDS